MRFRNALRHAPIAVDQAISSASNFLLALLVAQTASASGVGQFALATTVYWVVLGGTRALIAEPLLILRARQGDSRGGLHSPVGLAVGLSIGAALVGVGWTVLAGFGPLPCVLISLPVLIWQDALRYCSFSLGRHTEALASDLLWLVLLIGVGGVLLVGGHEPSVTVWLLVWAGSAIPSALLSSMRLGVWPSGRGVGAWWSRSRRQGVPMFGDFLVVSAAEDLLIFMLPVVTSLALLGQYKAALVINGPLQVMVTAASVIALPMLARRRGSGSDVPARAGLLIGAVMAAVSACYGLFLLLIPENWGELLLGDVWIGIGILPALVAFQYAVLSLNQGAILVLRAIGAVRSLLVLRTVMVPMAFGVPLLSARLWGLTGLGVAGVLLMGLYGVAWWSLVVRLQRRARVESGAVTA